MPRIGFSKIINRRDSMTCGFLLTRRHSASRMLSISPSGAAKKLISESRSCVLSTDIPGRSLCNNYVGNVYGRCWNCNSHPERFPFLVCTSCKAIQPVDRSADYFDLFGLEKKYEIKGETLESTYKEWQKKLHPDLVHSKSENEREFAAAQSARVNDAYSTIGDPLSRALYMLKLDGVNVNEEETIADPEFLTEIMEIREVVEEATSLHTLHEIQCEMKGKLQHWSDSFANAFQSKKYEEAVNCVRRMTYYQRVVEEIVKRI